MTDGILNNSPLYFFALVGLLALARLRDRRLVIAAAIYAATAGINGLHYNWNFGHGFPCRFMVIALPALALGLAWSLPLMLRRATTSLLVALALVISAESVLHTLTLPESGYKGFNLLGRSINRFYPFHLHFSEPGLQDLPLLDLGFWGLLLVFVLFFRTQHFGLRVAVIAVAGLAPLLWSRTDALTSRFEHSRSPYMTLLSSKTTPLRYTFGVPLRPVGKRISDPDGRLRARPGHTPAGTFNLGLIYLSHISSPNLTACPSALVSHIEPQHPATSAAPNPPASYQRLYLFPSPLLTADTGCSQPLQQVSSSCSQPPLFFSFSRSLRSLSRKRFISSTLASLPDFGEVDPHHANRTKAAGRAKTINILFLLSLCCMNSPLTSASSTLSSISSDI